MYVEFRSEKLAKVCNSDSARLARYGPERAVFIRRRLGQLVAAVHLADMRRFRAARMRTSVTCGRHAVLLAAGPTLDVLLRPREEDAPLDRPLDEEAIMDVVIDDIITITSSLTSAQSAAPTLARKRTSR